MNFERERKIKSIVLIILIFIALCSVINTNNNPNPIIQRVFKPIHIGGGTLYYAGLFPMLLVYYSLKELYKQNDISALSTRFRRIVAVILLICIFTNSTQSWVRLYKGYCNDLNSIYCYRNDCNISTWSSDNISHVVCKLDLENCSSKTEEFNVKVNLNDDFNNLKGLNLESNESLILYPHERRQFEITLNEGNMNNNVYYNQFGFTLYNNLQAVKFTKVD